MASAPDDGIWMLLKRGRIMSELTQTQHAFVDELVASGCTPTEAARRAGFQHPGQEAYRLMRKPHVVRAIKEAQNRLIAASGTNVALKTLLDVMINGTKEPARVSAARTWVEMAGLLKPDAAGERDKQLHEMSNEELAEFLVWCDKTIAEGGERPVIRVTDQTH